MNPNEKTYNLKSHTGKYEDDDDDDCEINLTLMMVMSFEENWKKVQYSGKKEKKSTGCM